MPGLSDQNSPRALADPAFEPVLLATEGVRDRPVERTASSDHARLTEFARTVNLDSVAILLDIDGTLLEFAPTPLEVRVPVTLRPVLERLWERTGGALSLLSGRPLEEIDFLFAPLRLPAIGGHGAEMRRSVTGDAERPNATPLDARLKQRFAAFVAGEPGLLLEDKGYAVAVHYRLAPEKELLVRSEVAAICAEWPSGAIEILPGKAVVEVKPAGFNKGTALRELMKHAPYAGRRPIFIGDDTTDEMAFAVLPEYSGIGFSVGREIAGLAGQFDTPNDVRQFLATMSESAGGER